jgi:hypothetical protein
MPQRNLSHPSHAFLGLLSRFAVRCRQARPGPRTWTSPANLGTDCHPTSRPRTHAHARMHACTHTHARMHARTRMHAHTHPCTSVDARKCEVSTYTQRLSSTPPWREERPSNKVASQPLVSMIWSEQGLVYPGHFFFVHGLIYLDHLCANNFSSWLQDLTFLMLHNC